MINQGHQIFRRALKTFRGQMSTILKWS